jgi:hypothetical protein
MPTNQSRGSLGLVMEWLQLPVCQDLPSAAGSVIPTNARNLLDAIVEKDTPFAVAADMQIQNRCVVDCKEQARRSITINSERDGILHAPFVNGLINSQLVRVVAASIVLKSPLLATAFLSFDHSRGVSFTNCPLATNDAYRLFSAKKVLPGAAPMLDIGARVNL